MGLSLSFDWTDRHNPNRVTGTKAGGYRAQTEWIGTTDTNELILVVAKAFGVDTDKSRLRSDLLYYRKELTLARRDHPLGVDLYGQIFDLERKSDLDAMLKDSRARRWVSARARPYIAKPWRRPPPRSRRRERASNQCSPGQCPTPRRSPLPSS